VDKLSYYLRGSLVGRGFVTVYPEIFELVLTINILHQSLPHNVVLLYIKMTPT
jgi:hypothetical protein